MKKAVLAVAFLTLAAVAGAHDHGSNGMGNTMGGPGMGPGREGGGGVIVGSDGTAYVTSETMSNGTTAASVTAISPAGATLWTATLGSGRGRLVLSDGNLIQVSMTEPTSTTAASTTLTAISTATGKTAWTLPINGIAAELHPFSGGTYAVVVTPAATSGGSATRALVAISNSGAVLWSVPLS